MEEEELSFELSSKELSFESVELLIEELLSNELFSLEMLLLLALCMETGIKQPHSTQKAVKAQSKEKKICFFIRHS